MTDQDPKPVPVYIIPRFDSEGRPSCYGCPLATNDTEYGYECNIGQDASYKVPGSTCPIHNPQEQQEPL